MARNARSERDDDLVLRLGFDLAFGVHGQIGREEAESAPVRADLDVFGLAVGQDDLFEVEAEELRRGRRSVQAWPE